jgi:Zn-dependent protease
MAMYNISRRKLKFSKIEIIDLLKAWFAISLAFGILLSPSFASLEFLFYLGVSAVTVGIAFLLHEIGHKLVAQRFGCWAEFRANPMMLFLAIIMSFFGFILVAPGAVVIQGYVTKSRNGKISLMGPLVNIVLGFIFFVIMFFASGVIKDIAYYGVLINAWIAIFNLIPVGNFDGGKILRWNKIIYAGLVIVAVGIMMGLFI